MTVSPIDDHRLVSHAKFPFYALRLRVDTNRWRIDETMVECEVCKRTAAMRELRDYAIRNQGKTLRSRYLETRRTVRLVVFAYLHNLFASIKIQRRRINMIKLSLGQEYLTPFVGDCDRNSSSLCIFRTVQGPHRCAYYPLFLLPALLLGKFSFRLAVSHGSPILFIVARPNQFAAAFRRVCRIFTTIVYRLFRIVERLVLAEKNAPAIRFERGETTFETGRALARSECESSLGKGGQRYVSQLRAHPPTRSTLCSLRSISFALRV